MRVLMLTSSYPKFPGDVTAPFIESIARGVSARGHQVDVVLPYHPELRRGNDEAVRFFPYEYASSDAWSRWGYAQSLEADMRVRKGIYMLAPFVALALRSRLSERLLAERYDVVHAHWVVPNAALVTDIVQNHRTAFVVSLHGSDVFVAERLWLARILAQRAFAAAGSVTACSGDLERRALRLGAVPERTRTVPYGVDVAAFAPDADPRHGAAIRARLGVAEDAFWILAFGRLVEKKGFRYLIEAAATLGGKACVLIAGEGDLRSELEARARETKAPVTFCGALTREAMAAALASADVAVVPSVVDRAGNVDGLPNALLEALAAGRPIVASRIAGIPDVIEHDRNGLLVPEKDSAALAEALRRLVNDAATRERLAGAARQTALTQLSWDRAARAFEECYVQAAALETR
jgi:glycosyltransferase involved in cell wall biosynthesis